MAEVKDDLSHYLREPAKGEIVITHGRRFPLIRCLVIK